MVEIFKTDVHSANRALQLIAAIHAHYPHCRASFDLEDCDRILRIVSDNKPVDAQGIRALLLTMGCEADVLPDEFFPGMPASSHH